jgi:hypothetical protein
MLKTTFIARAYDGLILCETYDVDTNAQVERLKTKARELLKKKSAFNKDNISCTVDIEDQKFQ